MIRVLIIGCFILSLSTFTHGFDIKTMVSLSAGHFSSIYGLGQDSVQLSRFHVHVDGEHVLPYLQYERKSKQFSGAIGSLSNYSTPDLLFKNAYLSDVGVFAKTVQGDMSLKAFGIGNQYYGSIWVKDYVGIGFLNEKLETSSRSFLSLSFQSMGAVPMTGLPTPTSSTLTADSTYKLAILKGLRQLVQFSTINYDINLYRSDVEGQVGYGTYSGLSIPILPSLTSKKDKSFNAISVYKLYWKYENTPILSETRGNTHFYYYPFFESFNELRYTNTDSWLLKYYGSFPFQDVRIVPEVYYIPEPKLHFASLRVMYTISSKYSAEVRASKSSSEDDLRLSLFVTMLGLI